MIDYLKRFWSEARSKATTYVALGIAGVSTLADRAEDLVNQWPAISAYLPKSKTLDHASHYLIAALGFLVVFTRVRRLLKGPQP